MGVGVRNLAIIYCNALIAWSCSPPTEEKYDRDEFLTASSRSSIAQQTELADEEYGTGKL